MDHVTSYVLATVVVLVLLALSAYVWYNYLNTWNTIKETGGQVVVFDALMKTPAWIRFRNCKFTTTSPQGVTKTWDVTAVLNGMAAAHPKNPTSMGSPTSLTLGGGAQAPLNPFSFVLKGFNDVNTVTTAAESATWAAVPLSSTKLTGEWTVLGAKKGTF